MCSETRYTSYCSTRLSRMLLRLARAVRIPRTTSRNVDSVRLRLQRFSIAPSPVSLPKFELRPYQRDCIDACCEELEHGSRRIAVSLPTGAGKTVVFTHLIDEVNPREGQGDKTMILVHRRELALQAAETCRRLYPDKKIEVEMANFHAGEDADIVIASVQTLTRGRYENFDPKDFKMMIIDECHHAAADSYIEVLNHFGIMDNESKIALVGFSATLRREDGKRLSTSFDKVVFNMSLEQLIFAKHLVDAKVTTVTLVDADLGKVKSARGDFIISALDKAVNTEKNNSIVLATYLHFVETHNIRSTMLFGVNINHVERLCELFRSKGVNASYVTSKTKADIRSKTIADFKAGKISVLMNCGIFTEGTDMPNIDCILLTRPTRSKTLLIQMIGRGLRLHASKEFCHLVDFVGINNKNIVTVPSLRKLPVEFEADEMSFEEMDEEKIRMEEELAEMERELKEEKKLQRLQKLEFESLKIDLTQTQNRLDSFIDPMYDNDMPRIPNLELTTFESLRDFIKSKQRDESDYAQLMKSKYPWVRGPTGNVWLLDASQRSDYSQHKTQKPEMPPDVSKMAPERPNYSHFRLEIHHNGLRKNFFKEVCASYIYPPEKIQELYEVQGTLYTLAEYTERNIFKDRKTFYEQRWRANLARPVSVHIDGLIEYLEAGYHQTSMTGYKTKYSPWRSTEATTKQLETLKRVAKKSLTEAENQRFLANIDELTKGQASDALFAYGIFRKRGFKPALPKHILSENAITQVVNE